jgi:hypothetical protein
VATSALPGLQARSPTASWIESLLSARVFVRPQLNRGRLYFISNLSGRLSLYAMPEEGGVPEPLLPPQIALQNPELIVGDSFRVLPELERIIVMLDRDGDEKYQPFAVPLDGGFPEAVAPKTFERFRSHFLEVDAARGIAYFAAESREEAMFSTLRCDLASGEVEILARSMYGAFPLAFTPDHSRVVCADQYLVGDLILYEPDGVDGRKFLYGTPLDEREPGVDYPLAAFNSAHTRPRVG